SDLLYLLARFFPFSLFFFYALWRVFRRPAGDVAERRLERFLACWVLAGLVLFSLAAHHRADLLLPLWPACALLAGRAMARLARRVGAARFTAVTAVVVAGLMAGLYAQYRSEEHTSELQSRENLVCRLLLEKKKKKTQSQTEPRQTRQ